MKLPKLQDDNKEAMKLRSEGLPKSWENIKQVLHYQGLPYIPKVIHLKLISRHYNDLLAGHFGIEKTRKLIAKKYYWPMLQQNVKAYVMGCDVCLASKAVCHKPYGDFQLLPVPTHRWKDLSMDFVINLIRKIFYPDLITLGCSDPQIKQIACRLPLNALIPAGLSQIHQITLDILDQLEQLKAPN